DDAFGDSVCKEIEVGMVLGTGEGNDGDRVNPRRGIRYFLDLRDKAIAPPGNGLDVLVRARLFTQSAAQSRNITRQISFFDGGVGPNQLDHLVLAQDVTVVPYEQEQDVEALGRQRHDFAAA